MKAENWILRRFGVLAVSMMPSFIGCARPNAAPGSGASTVSRPHAGSLDKSGHPPTNVLPVFEGVICGSAPEGDRGLEALAAKGVKTIMSVDGARPDIERARQLGMRYVHIPTGYDGVNDAAQDQIAAAMIELPKPIYVHCHHGKHRGPAAAAVGAIALGEWTKDQGLAFLKQAGTSTNYPGLYESVRRVDRFDRSRSAELAGQLREVARVSNFVSAMNEIDETMEHLSLCKDAGWSAPSEHPDLVPYAEAGRMAALYGQLMESDDYAQRPADFREIMALSAATANTLAGQLRRNDQARLDSSWDQLRQSCTSCHKVYRDVPN